MNFIFQPWQFFLLCLAGLIDSQQQKIIDYLVTENQILREKHGKKRIERIPFHKKYYIMRFAQTKSIEEKITLPINYKNSRSVSSHRGK